MWAVKQLLHRRTYLSRQKNTRSRHDRRWHSPLDAFRPLFTLDLHDLHVHIDGFGADASTRRDRPSRLHEASNAV